MAVRHRLTPLLVSAAQLLAGWLSGRHYWELPQLCPADDAVADHVSIVIPARDEEARLPALLASLNRLEYPSVDVIVVDDGSTDATARIAEAAGARMLRSDGPPPGWTGKAHACWLGAAEARGEWVLFTDADTVHAPRSLTLAVTSARRSGAALFSLLARQQCRTLWEQLLLPYAYALYFTGARRINQPGRPAVANGQYMLIRRDAYVASGGHSVVRGEVIEDVALARRFAACGYRVVLAHGEHVLTVRMYEGLGSLWEGLAKNAFRFVRVTPATGLPTALAGLAFAATPWAVLRARSTVSRILLLFAPGFALLPSYRRFGAPSATALLAPIAAMVFQALALDSIRRTALRGGTVWKGRRY